jgi:hypothetical protein
VILGPSNVLPASPPSSLSLPKFLEDIHGREEMYRATANHERLKDTGLQSFELTSPLMNYTHHGTRFYPKPFKLLFREASRQKYRRLWIKFIVFIFRAYRMAPRLRRAVLGIRLTKEQLKQLKTVWTDPSLDAETRNDRYSEYDAAADYKQGYSSSSDDEDGEDEEAEEEGEEEEG